MGAGPRDSLPVVPGRPSRLLLAASHPDRLFEAWQRVLANRGAAGGDGVTVDRFAHFADTAIPRLSAMLRDGSYRPAPARRVQIAKRDGGTRTLTIPAVVDRVAQGATALTLGPALEAQMEDSSFAYRRGRGVADAVRRVAALRRDGFRWVVDADIRSYFDSIPHAPLLDRVECHSGDDALIDLIAQWLEWYAPGGRGVPQGSPLSPLLANLYLDELDEAMDGRGIRMVRYADDFVVLARNAATAQDALAQASTILAEHGLELHPDKSRVIGFDQGFRFLGHLFVRSMVLRETDWEVPDEAATAAAEAVRAVDVPPAAPFADAGPPGNAAASPGWRVLYLMEPGRVLHADGESFAVREGEAIVFKVQAGRVGRVELGERTSATPGALELAAAHDILVARIDGHGRTLAEWVPPGAVGLHGRRHLAQARVILDPERRLALARTLVVGRIRGQRAVLARANRDRRDETLTAAIARMKPVLRSAAVAPTVPAAMGWEGFAGQLYWPALACALDGDIGFSGRRRRREGAEAFDLILNALSWLLARDIRVALHRRGLHPGMSVLHETRDGEEALGFDLMEEFRAPLVEATAVALVNRRAIRASLFARSAAGRLSLAAEGWAAVIRGYEATLDRPSASPLRGGDRVGWRVRIGDQAAMLAAHFESDEPYVPIDLGY